MGFHQDQDHTTDGPLIYLINLRYFILVVKPKAEETAYSVQVHHDQSNCVICANCRYRAWISSSLKSRSRSTENFSTAKEAITVP